MSLLVCVFPHVCRCVKVALVHMCLPLHVCAWMYIWGEGVGGGGVD